MTPRQLAVECENAFDTRDRQSLVRYLAQLVATATPPDFSRLTREQLEDRRTALYVQRADINDRLVAMDAAGHSTLPLVDLLRQPSASLDSSD